MMKLSSKKECCDRIQYRIKPAGEARPSVITMRSAVTELELAKSTGRVGPSWSRASGRAAAVADVKSAGKARLPGIAKQSATTEPELAESSDEVGPSWSRANGSAAAAATVKSAGKARPPGIAKQSATTEPELMESCGGAGLLGPEHMAIVPPMQQQ